MKLIEKIIQDKRTEGAKKAINPVIEEEAKALGLRSGNPIRRMIKGEGSPNIKTIIAMEKRYGYSYEELNAEAK